MAKAKILKQLNFAMKDRPGLLEEITSATIGAGVNLLSICAYGMEGKAFFMLTTNSNVKAKRALAKIGAKAKEEAVIAVEMPNRAGALQNIAKKIADANININYVYGTAATGKTAICIFSTSDDKKVLKVINK
jgi:hypothetical protein